MCTSLSQYRTNNTDHYNWMSACTQIKLFIHVNKRIESHTPSHKQSRPGCTLLVRIIVAQPLSFPFLGGKFDEQSLKNRYSQPCSCMMMMILMEKIQIIFPCLMKCFSAWDECHSTPSCPNLSFLYILTIYESNEENYRNPLWMTWST